MIILTHPDKMTREAVLATILAVWPDAPCSAQELDQVSEDDLVLALATPPQKIAALIKQIQTMHRHGQLPVSLQFGTRVLNTRTREWQDGKDAIILTEKEVGVLLYLWQKKTPVTREDLLRDIWQYASDADTHTIETHIYRLRQKIEEDPANPQFLITGKDGYQLAANSSA